MSIFTGSCLCGSVNYKSNSDPLVIQNCHCDQCRKATGSVYLTNLFIKEENFKLTPFLTERYQGVLKIEKKWINSGIILDITSNTTGPLKLPLLGDLDPRPSFSKTFHIINAQLTKSWNNIFESYGGVKNLLNFLPPENSIARPFDPFDRLVVFDDTGNVVPTQNNPYSLTFDPSYVYASNQGVRFFLGLRWKYN